MSAILESSHLFSKVPEARPALAFNRVSGECFHQQVRHAINYSPFHRANISLQDSYEQHDCWLSEDRAAGFAVTADRELLNVFSLIKGHGVHLMNFAVSRYPVLNLNCFADGYLQSLYASYGFEVVAREQNWNKTGPDVVFMRRDGLGFGS